MGKNKLGFMQRFVYSRMRNGYRIRQVVDLQNSKVRTHLMFGGDQIVRINKGIVDALLKRKLIDFQAQEVKAGLFVTIYRLAE